MAGRIILFLILGFGWVAFAITVFKFINKILLKNKDNLTFGNLIIDLVFLCLGFYIFCSNKYWQEIYLELDRQIVVMIILAIVYFICVGIFGYAGLNQHFRYGVGALVIWMGIFLGIFLFIFNRSQLSSIPNQLWAVYTWYMMILFPLEVGNLVRKLELYVKLRKNRNIS